MTAPNSKRKPGRPRKAKALDTTPDANGIAVPAALKDIIITDNIIGTVAAQNVTAGVIRIDVVWEPLSGGGNVVAA